MTKLATLTPMRHVIWDWNGTLFDDQHIVVGAVNATIGPLGAELITADDYRRLYTRPVRVFYDRLLGRPVTDGEWEAVDDAFHGHYRSYLGTAGLHTQAFEAIERVKLADSSQSLLSMFFHDELLPLVDQHGLTGELLRIDGLRGTRGAKKAESMRDHLSALIAHPSAPDDPRAYLVVGDALDDAAAAKENGVACVLFDGGSHDPAALEETGYPVVDSLIGALDLAGL